MAHRVLIFGCEPHVAHQLEKFVERVGGVAMTAVTEAEFGRAFTELDPTHILAGSNSAFEHATKIVEKRQSSAGIAWVGTGRRYQ